LAVLAASFTYVIMARYAEVLLEVFHANE